MDTLFRPITLSPPQRLTNVRSWHGHMPFAFWIMEALRPRIFVELGTHKGDSYCAFCQAAKELALSTACYAIDTWKGDEHTGFYGEEVYEDLRRVHDADYGAFSRLVRSTFDEAVSHFPDKNIDLLHIDGLHTYEAVKHDFEAWRPKLSERAVVLFHDINVRELGFGVWQVWDELCRQYPHFSFMHSHGLGMLVVGENVPPAIKRLCGLSEQEAERVRHLFARLGHTVLITSERDVLAQRAAHLESTLTEREGRIAGLQAQLTERDGQIAGLQAQIAGLQTQIAGLQAQLAVGHAQIQMLQGELIQREQRGVALQGELKAVYRSRSWRITKPLRLMMRRMRQLRGSPLLLPLKLVYWTVRGRLRQRLLQELTIWRLARSGLFDRQYYLQQNPDVAVAGIDPLRHYVFHGASEGRNPHPLFDAAYYLKDAADLATSGINPLEHYIRQGAAEGRDPHPLFDSDWYLMQNPDLAVSGTNPLIHYVRHGAAEGRDPHPLFDSDWYLMQNPELAASGTNPLIHYVRHGAAAGRDPHPLFNTDWYLGHHPDVGASRTNPLEDYIRRSAANGQAVESNPLEQCLRQATAQGLEKDEPAKYLANVTVAVVVHLYYVEMWDEINAWLSNIPIPFTLFVTAARGTIEGTRSRITRQHPSARIVEIENVGYDVKPFLDLIGSGALDHYTVVLKLHSKKGTYMPVAWRHLLMSGTLGSRILVGRVLLMFQRNEGLCMVGPKDAYLDGAVHVGSNGPALRRVFEFLYPGESFPQDWGFFAGTMFWARPRLFANLARVVSSQFQYEPSSSVNDGTLAHALERMFGLLATVEQGQIGLIAAPNEASVVGELRVLRAPGARLSGPFEPVLERYQALLARKSGGPLLPATENNALIPHHDGARAFRKPELRRDFAERDGQLTVLRSPLGERDQQIAGLQAQLAVGHVQIQTLQGELAQREQREAALQGELAAVYGSRSWRITKPLRLVMMQMRQLRASPVLLPLKAVSWMLRGHLRSKLQVEHAVRCLSQSGMFDRDYYLGQYPDVAASGVDPVRHYVVSGARERRNPNRIFNTVFYLERYSDVAAAGENPLAHFVENGAREGRHPNPYSEWVERFTRLTDEDRNAIARHIASLPRKPLISVLMPVYNTPHRWLCEAIDSVIAQLYPCWELCIADDCSTDLACWETLKSYAARDPRVKIVRRSENGNISRASNSALALATGEFVALLDHDDELTEHALYMVAVELNAHPEADLIYSDEDKIDENGQRSDPYFKSDWNPELFYGHNLIAHLGVYRTELVRKVGGFRPGFEGSQDWDLALRIIERTTGERICHIPHVLYHWRMHSQSAAQTIAAKSYAPVVGRKAVQEHFERRGIDATVTEALNPAFNRVIYPLPHPLPLVSLLVPTRDRLELLRRSIEGLLRITDYPRLEVIIIDNGSRESETPEYLRVVQHDPRIRVIRHDAPFNLSELNNIGCRVAEGEIIGLINNDIKVIHAGWLREMVCHAVRPEVGIVGAKLYLADDRIQHAGVILGIGGVAAHRYRFFPRDATGYQGRAILTQNLSAVTGACMVTRRAVYEEVGGLDESLRVAYNDVDFCLRVRERGYAIIWTPYAELYHLESASREYEDSPEKVKRIQLEAGFMHQRWGGILRTDPYYNPNLTLDREDFSLAYPPRVSYPWRDFERTSRIETAPDPAVGGKGQTSSQMRSQIADSFLMGKGIEIGALHNPLPVSKHAEVRYVDRLSVAELRQHYPELNECHLIEPDVIDDGEQLEKFADESQDFIIANHYLEHTENPIACLKNFLRVLKPSGTLYMALPDKRYTFDRDRPLTTIEHLQKDYTEGPAISRSQHYFEWVRFSNNRSAEEAAHLATELEQRHYSIHFHTWTNTSFLEFLAFMNREHGLGLDLVFHMPVGEEFICILRKPTGSST